MQSQQPMYNQPQQQQTYWYDQKNQQNNWAWQQQQQQIPVYSTGIYGQYYTSSSSSQQPMVPQATDVYDPTASPMMSTSRNELAAHVVDGLQELNASLSSSTGGMCSNDSEEASRLKKLREIYNILHHQNVATINRPDSDSPEPFINFLNKDGKDQKVSGLAKYILFFIFYCLK